MKLILLALTILVPSAAAVSALEAAPRLGVAEARLLVRAEGALSVVADAAIDVGVAAPGETPARFVAAPATMALERGPWHGLDDATEIVLRRDANEPRSVEITDASGAGLLLEWPAVGRAVPMPPLALLVAAFLGATLMERRAG